MPCGLRLPRPADRSQLRNRRRKHHFTCATGPPPRGGGCYHRENSRFRQPSTQGGLSRIGVDGRRTYPFVSFFGMRPACRAGLDLTRRSLRRANSCFQRSGTTLGLVVPRFPDHCRSGLRAREPHAIECQRRSNGFRRPQKNVTLGVIQRGTKDQPTRGVPPRRAAKSQLHWTVGKFVLSVCVNSGGFDVVSIKNELIFPEVRPSLLREVPQCRCPGVQRFVPN